MKLHKSVVQSMLSLVSEAGGALDPALLVAGLYTSGSSVNNWLVTADVPVPSGAPGTLVPLTAWNGVFREDESNHYLMSKMISFSGDAVLKNQIVFGVFLALAAAPNTVLGIFPLPVPQTMVDDTDQLSIVLKIPASLEREEYGIVVID